MCYLRFCEIKHSDDDFVTLLHSNARLEVLERFQNVEITDENGTRQIRDERIELVETGEEFRRIVLETADGEEIEYLTTPATALTRSIETGGIDAESRLFIELNQSQFHLTERSSLKQFLILLLRKWFSRWLY